MRISWSHGHISILTRIARLPSSRAVLAVPLGVSVRGTPAGARRKLWKHCGSRRALPLKAACQQIDSHFVCCRGEDDYQKGLAVLLAEVRRRPKVPSLVAFDLLEIQEVLSEI